MTFLSILILASDMKYVTVTLKQKFWEMATAILEKRVAFKEMPVLSSGFSILTPQSWKRHFYYLLRVFRGYFEWIL